LVGLTCPVIQGMRDENNTGPQINTNSSFESMVDKPLSYGALPSNPQEDLGWMYARGFQDLDGHLWEIFTWTSMPCQSRKGQDII
jgi:predicted lactoylglutathione lyase